MRSERQTIPPWSWRNWGLLLLLIFSHFVLRLSAKQTKNGDVVSLLPHNTHHDLESLTLDPVTETNEKIDQIILNDHSAIVFIETELTRTIYPSPNPQSCRQLSATNWADPDNRKHVDFALLLAAYVGETESIQCCLALGANINAQSTKQGYTPLLVAALQGNLDAFNTLAHLGADLGAEDKNGLNALFSAISVEQLTIIQAWQKLGFDINEQYHGDHPIIFAAWNGLTSAMRELIQLGANINAQNLHNQTALHAAAQTGRIEAAQLLITAGVDVDIAEENNNTALYHAINSDHNEIANMLLAAGSNIEHKNSNQQTALFVAAAHGNVEMLRTLLEAGADLNHKNIHGHSIIIEAILTPHQLHLAEIIERLAYAGADINMQTPFGNTPLHVAIFDSTEHALSCLLKAGAKLEILNNNGNTPLLQAAIEKKPNMVKQLCDAGANPDASTPKGITALHTAARDGESDTVRHLIDCNANIEIRETYSKWQLTPIAAALFNSKYNIVEMLANAGADLATKKYDGKDLVGLAIVEKNIDHIKFLRKLGVAIKNHHIALAKQNDFKELLDLLDNSSFFLQLEIMRLMTKSVLTIIFLYFLYSRLPKYIDENRRKQEQQQREAEAKCTAQIIQEQLETIIGHFYQENVTIKQPNQNTFTISLPNAPVPLAKFTLQDSSILPEPMTINRDIFLKVLSTIKLLSLPYQTHIDPTEGTINIILDDITHKQKPNKIHDQVISEIKTELMAHWQETPQGIFVAIHNNYHQRMKNRGTEADFKSCLASQKSMASIAQQGLSDLNKILADIRYEEALHSKLLKDVTTSILKMLKPHLPDAQFPGAKHLDDAYLPDIAAQYDQAEKQKKTLAELLDKNNMTKINENTIKALRTQVELTETALSQFHDRESAIQHTQQRLAQNIQITLAELRAAKKKFDLDKQKQQQQQASQAAKAREAAQHQATLRAQAEAQKKRQEREKQEAIARKQQWREQKEAEKRKKQLDKVTVTTHSVFANSSTNQSHQRQTLAPLKEKAISLGDLLARFAKSCDNAALPDDDDESTITYKYAMLAECLRLFQLTATFTEHPVAQQFRHALMHNHRYLVMSNLINFIDLIVNKPGQYDANKLENALIKPSKNQLLTILNDLTTSDFYLTIAQSENEKPSAEVQIATICHYLNDLRKITLAEGKRLENYPDKIQAIKGIMMCIGECRQQLFNIDKKDNPTLQRFIACLKNDEVSGFLNMCLDLRNKMGHDIAEHELPLTAMQMCLNKAIHLHDMIYNTLKHAIASPSHGF